MTTKHLATLVGAAAVAAAIVGAPLAAAEPNQPQESCQTAGPSSTVCQRRAMLRSKMPLRRWISTHTAARPGCSERKVNDDANNTEAHRTAARGSRSRGGDRRSAGSGRRRTGATDQPYPPQSVLRATGRRRVQVRIARQRSAERPAAGDHYFPSRGRLESHDFGSSASRSSGRPRNAPKLFGDPAGGSLLLRRTSNRVPASDDSDDRNSRKLPTR